MTIEGTEGDVFLISDLIQTHRLKKGQKTTIGRDDINHIVLKNRLVSRRHAEISWQDDHYLIRDLNSNNGTMVNDKTVKSVKLKNGDRIQIGGFQFTVKHATYKEISEYIAQEKEKSLDQATMKVHKEDIKIAPDGMSGKLSSINAFELIQMLHNSKKTGVLMLRNNAIIQETGMIYFNKGNIVHAIQEAAEGELAIRNVLPWVEGEFEFQSDITPDKTTVERPVSKILSSF